MLPGTPQKILDKAFVREEVACLLRDRTCRFPGCHRRGSRCEIDPTTGFDGTDTVHTNLHCLCPRHHHLKEEAGWHVTRAPDGTTRWITLTGRHPD